jgi:hypothetical protein
MTSEIQALFKTRDGAHKWQLAEFPPRMQIRFALYPRITTADFVKDFKVIEIPSIEVRVYEYSEMATDTRGNHYLVYNEI